MLYELDVDACEITLYAAGEKRQPTLYSGGIVELSAAQVELFHLQPFHGMFVEAFQTPFRRLAVLPPDSLVAKMSADLKLRSQPSSEPRLKEAAREELKQHLSGEVLALIDLFTEAGRLTGETERQALAKQYREEQEW